MLANLKITNKSCRLFGKWVLGNLGEQTFI